MHGCTPLMMSYLKGVWPNNRKKFGCGGRKNHDPQTEPDASPLLPIDETRFSTSQQKIGTRQLKASIFVPCFGFQLKQLRVLASRLRSAYVHIWESGLHKRTRNYVFITGLERIIVNKTPFEPFAIG
jgi:hypothetical protein